jgi:cysteine desulfurase
MGIIYFDNSATTKPHREVIDEVAECMENHFANPSSAHRLGLDAEKKVKVARERVAKLIGSSPEHIIFTSGGSEANNTAIRGVVSPGDHIITSKIEHPSVMKTMQYLEKEGCEVSYIGVDSRGIINMEELKGAIKENTKLVSIMHVNNEIGAIQPIYNIVKAVKEKNRRTKIHTDCVQSAGKIKIDVEKLGIDMASLSAHKIHGPKGVGALYIRENQALRPLIYGGGQEMDLRSGTENVPGISGFGLAAKMILDDMEGKIKHVNEVKSHFIDRISEIDGAVVNSPADDLHLGNILNISFLGVKGEVLLHALEDYNIFVSTGSACSARRSHKNYVLPAIGLKPCYVESAVRFSFSYLNTIDEVDYTIEKLKTILSFLRRIKK